MGSDYIVFVSRQPTKKGWAVEIAEIGTVLPALCDMSFAEAHATPVSLRTCLTLKNRQPWFHVPGGDLPDFRKIFRRSFEKVFPDQWIEVGGSDLGHENSQQTTEVPSPPVVKNNHSASIEEIRVNLERMWAVDDWEKLDSDTE